MAGPFPGDARALERMDFCPTPEAARACTTSRECLLAARHCLRHRLATGGDAARLAPLFEQPRVTHWESRGVGRAADVVVPKGACALLAATGERRAGLWAGLGAPRALHAYGYAEAAPPSRIQLEKSAGDDWLDGAYLPSLGSLAWPELRGRSRLRDAYRSGVEALRREFTRPLDILKPAASGPDSRGPPSWRW